MVRYEAGETLASIARTYDCSPPAISYVVSRSRMRHETAPEPRAATATEPQLVKAASAEPSPTVPPPALPQLTAPQSPPQPQAAEVPAARPQVGLVHAADRHPEPPRHDGNGFGRDGSAAPGLLHSSIAADGRGDPRRIQLPLNAPGNGSAHGNGNGSHHPDEPRREEFHRPSHNGDGAQSAPQRASAEPRPFDMPRFPPRPSGNGEPPRNGAANHAEHRDGRGSSIDTELRARVDGDIAAFLAAFDAALAQDTQDTRAVLREATDRLLRAGARTRIELERLEARAPLPRRDPIDRSEPAWRGR